MNQQHSPIADKLAARLVAANAATAGKPIDLGGNNIPPGVRDGIAKIVSMEWKVQDKEGKKVPKGERYFFARAIAVYPDKLPNGRKVAKCSTFIEIPWCDTAANPQTQRKATTFEENYDKFRMLMEALSGAPCRATDYNGIMAYWTAVMKTLCDPKNPTYVHFDTWSSNNSKALPGQQPKQDTGNEFVNQKWTGRAQWDGKADPAAGVVTSGTAVGTNGPPTESAPAFSEGPQGRVDPRTVSQTDDTDASAEVAELVQIATADPTGETEDGRIAGVRLTEMAQAIGWSEEQTGAAESWEEVGRMALTSPSEDEDGETEQPEGDEESGVTVGSKWKFCKRDKTTGEKLKDAKKGTDLPSIDVEVVTIDAENQTCTVKSLKDGKDVIDLRSRKPTVVKWEWLEE